MNRIHPWTLAICLTLTRILPAAEFGTVPDPYTGNWSGTVKKIPFQASPTLGEEAAVGAAILFAGMVF